MLVGVGRVAVLLVVVWLVLVLLAAVFQRQLIHLPDRSSPEPPGDVEVVTLTTTDGLTLTAWYLPPAAPAATTDGDAGEAAGPRGATVLLAPGNAGNRAGRLPTARELVARGHGVLLLEYRGYGGNPGRPTEEGLLEDARAARDHLDARADDDPDVDTGRIAYLGESLGSAVVAALAADRPPAALVLRSPFPELADVGRAAYPVLPVGLLLRDRHPTSEHLAGYDGPVLVVAGDADRIVPTELSRRVAADAGAELVEVAGADHNDAALFVGEVFLDAVDRHLRDALAPG